MILHHHNLTLMPTYLTPSATETPMCDTCSKNKNKKTFECWCGRITICNCCCCCCFLALLAQRTCTSTSTSSPHSAMKFKMEYLLNRCVEPLGKSLSDLSTRHNEQTSHMKLSLLECRNSYLMQRKEETSCKTRVASGIGDQDCVKAKPKRRPSGVNSKDIQGGQSSGQAVSTPKISKAVGQWKTKKRAS